MIKIKILDFIKRKNTVAIKTRLKKEEAIKIIKEAKDKFKVEIDYVYSDAFWGYGDIRGNSMKYHPAVVDLTVLKFENKTIKNNFIKHIKKELNDSVD